MTTFSTRILAFCEKLWDWGLEKERKQNNNNQKLKWEIYTYENFIFLNRSFSLGCQKSLPVWYFGLYVCVNVWIKKDIKNIVVYEKVILIISLFS